MACAEGCTSFQPAAQWTQDPDNHILCVCLPGFQKDEFKVQVDSGGKLTIRGRKPLGDGKYMRLEQVFDVPKDSHFDQIRGKFQDARLSLFIPKKEVTEKKAPARAVSCEQRQRKEEPQIPIQAKPTPKKQEPKICLVSDDMFEEYKKKAAAWKVRIEENVEGWLDYGVMDGLLETISNNRKAIAVAAAAFTVGFYVSGKLRSCGR